MQSGKTEEHKSPMWYSMISSQVLLEKKPRFFHEFPVQVQKLWNKWELRLVVLLSLFFQILLISLGDRRRNINKNWVQIILWLTYLCADWVAAVALGILSHSIDGQLKTNELTAFWAPFLLLHLGGPDNITAFALEDNELWLRHLLGLGVQGSIASYVSIRSWTGTGVSFLSLLMYVPAIVKYGERTWVLSSASKERLRDSMLRPPDPGPSYAKFMDEYSSKEEEGFQVTIGSIEEESLQSRRYSTHNTSGLNDGDAEDLVKAHYFFEIFKRLFAFLILSYEDWEESKLFFQKISYQKAFNLIDIELGFMFDVLYTKAAVVYSMIGCILRTISSSFTFIVFIVFLKVDKGEHPPTDIIITYLLLALAIILEIYGAIVLITSDLVFLWLRERRCPLAGLARRLWKCRRQRRTSTRWSNSMAQYSLLRVWLKDDPARLDENLRKLLGIEKMLRKYCYTTYRQVPKELKEFIFQQLCRKSDKAINFKEAKCQCASRGGEVLQRGQYSDLHGLLGWSIDDVEYDQSILIWHIATELCYQSDGIGQKHKEGNISKVLSDYMLYLLLVCPFMLPEGIGEVRYLDTEAEAMHFFQEKTSNLKTKRRPLDLLLQVKTDIPPIEVKGPKSKSVLFDACRLANQLKELERNKRWEIISVLWVEMLSFAAAQCKGQNHAKQLGQGGELLTHVWLLMAHLGITEQFEMQTVASKLICR
ncbi:uncharacterized protein LOC122066135 [Macadamia integrifolia]|uniref:uncharacterized protein LOC122066135 n=1 Tax=Macadamia integrifolia TaxID=60698 RepID=UPI001C4EE400|nr:uncharacterized protein LOC122066135 [Macadamia integrifolia]